MGYAPNDQRREDSPPSAATLLARGTRSTTPRSKLDDGSIPARGRICADKLLNAIERRVVTPNFRQLEPIDGLVAQYRGAQDIYA